MAGLCWHLNVTVDISSWHQLNCFQTIYIIRELEKERITTHKCIGVKQSNNNPS